MEVEERELRNREWQNKKLLEKIKNVGKGKVDCHWEERDIKQFAKVHAKRARERETEIYYLERRISAMKREFSCKPESKYSREKLEDDWKGTVRCMYNKRTLFPCSDWWHEYLEYVAGDNPQRRPPPRPHYCCGQRLEDIEERARNQIGCDLFRINREQLEKEQQLKQRELEAALRDRHQQQLQLQAVEQPKCWNKVATLDANSNTTSATSVGLVSTPLNYRQDCNAGADNVSMASLCTDVTSNEAWI